MIQLFEVLTTVLLLGGLMWGMMRFMLRDIHTDLAGLKSDMKEMKHDIKLQSQRSDKLYEILIDLVKQKKM